MLQETRKVFESLGDDAAVAAFHRGQLVLEAYSGAVTRRSLLLVASSTKFVESACIALLVDRGLLRYDDRIVAHWPGFARGGEDKKQVTVRDLMMHRAGLLYFAHKLPLADLFDRGKLVEHLELQQRDGRVAQGYHALTRGLISGELLRCVDPRGRSLGTFFREEVAEPHGLRFWIGLPEEEEKDVVELEPQARPDMEAQLPYERDFWRDITTRPESLAARTLWCLDYGVPPDQRKIRACEMPSSNGVGTVVALAKLADLCSRPGLLRRETIEAACELRPPYARDAVMMTDVTFTQGGWGQFTGARDSAGGAPMPVSIGWGGAGGSMVRFVPSLDLSFAFVTRNLGVRMAMNDPRPNAVLAAATREIGARIGSSRAAF